MLSFPLFTTQNFMVESALTNQTTPGESREGVMAQNGVKNSVRHGNPNGKLPKKHLLQPVLFISLLCIFDNLYLNGF